MRDIYYENTDDKCYVNVRIMTTSPLYGLSSDILPLFDSGNVLVFSSNKPKHYLPNNKLVKSLKISKEKTGKNLDNQWFLSFVCEDRFQADRVIAQIYELEGMTEKERSPLFYNFLYKNKISKEDELSYLKSIAEMTVSLDFDSKQDSKYALKLTCDDKKRRTLNKIFNDGIYNGFAIQVFGQDSSRMIVAINNGNFSWTHIKYTNIQGEVIERGRE